ncbi:ABC transporter [Halalkalibacter hemicellulosilyticusJCM 9152]|uniref:ABC transporter n=1 Tax=Halalkalibacter hemicellulosilyticusJCM 9152 TaxID=1236971 RepID=W4QKQ5_9BACI|nr:ABC transporter [Halalkalibacter hemicellulosilyticusJCM 9152]
MLGYLGAFIIAHFAEWPFLVTMPVVIGGVLFSMLIGIIFGILPADKASKIDPISSLHFE